MMRRGASFSDGCTSDFCALRHTKYKIYLYTKYKFLYICIHIQNFVYLYTFVIQKSNAKERYFDWDSTRSLSKDAQKCVKLQNRLQWLYFSQCRHSSFVRANKRITLTKIDFLLN